MPYIDKEYYIEDYKGVDAGELLDKYIVRASDLIDQVTGYKINDVDTMPDFIQKQIKKAAAAQVEFYVVQGGSEEVDAGTNDFGSVRVGSFNYNLSSGQSQADIGSKDVQRVSPATLSYLEPTGLLYQGLG